MRAPPGRTLRKRRILTWLRELERDGGIIEKVVAVLDEVAEAYPGPEARKMYTQIREEIARLRAEGRHEGHQEEAKTLLRQAAKKFGESYLYTRTRIAWAWVCLPLAALLGGCGGDGSAPGEATVVRDTLAWGVERVVSVPPSEAGWTLVEEIRIGTVGGEGPESFARLKGLAVLADGRIAVLESLARELRIFGADGVHLATHGRHGEGPGEFQDANGLMLAPDGRLWVPDARIQRMSVFDAADGFVESFRFEPWGWGWTWGGRMASDGRIFYPAHEAEGQRRRLLRVYDQTMTETATLPMQGVADFSVEQPSAFCWSSPSGGMGCIAVPWYAGSVTHIDPSGAAWSTATGNAAYRIGKWTPGGDTAFVAVVERAPVPVAPAERDSAEALVRDATPEGADLDLSRIPSVKPMVRDIFTSAEGNAWVRTRIPGVETAFDVLAPDGDLIRTVTWDATLASSVEPVARGDSLWAVVVDDLGVQYVVRARVSPAS